MGPEQTVGTISLNSHLFTIRLAHSSSDAVGDPISQVSRSNLRWGAIKASALYNGIHLGINATLEANDQPANSRGGPHRIRLCLTGRLPGPCSRGPLRFFLRRSVHASGVGGLSLPPPCLRRSVAHPTAFHFPYAMALSNSLGALAVHQPSHHCHHCRSHSRCASWQALGPSAHRKLLSSLRSFRWNSSELARGATSMPPSASYRFKQLSASPITTSAPRSGRIRKFSFPGRPLLLGFLLATLQPNEYLPAAA